MPKRSGKGAKVAGVGAGTHASAENYADNVLFHAQQGHGFAAEKANHLYDRMTGKDARIVGGDNARNGADRLVGGVRIQTKYHRTARESINACFEGGRFRYLSDGVPMQIEVPSDQYASAVKAMERRIRAGQVPGVRDPEAAKQIVRRGHFTYAQARNVARFGTIEGLTYDAVNGIQVAGWAGGVSSLLTFGTAVWSGASVEDAMERAVYSGLQVGGISWASSVVAAQLGRTSLEHGMRGATDWAVRQLGPKASAMLANAVRSGSNIYGAAAMSHLSKLLRGNVVTGLAVTAVMSTGDVIALFRGRVSVAQVCKNITRTAAGVAGGTAGWMGGAAAGTAMGTAVFPGPGSAIGGVIGGLVGALGGGLLGTEASGAILDCIVEDDAVEMMKIFEAVLATETTNYLISETEAEDLIASLQDIGFPTIVCDMYAATDRHACARSILRPLIEDLARQRPTVRRPSSAQLLRSIGTVLEQLPTPTS